MLQFRLPKRSVTALAFRPDGRQLVALGEDERLDVFDLPGGRHATHPGVIEFSHAAKWAAGFVAANGMFAAVGGDLHYAVVDPRGWKWEGSFGASWSDDAPVVGGLSPDGRLVAVCRPDRLVVDQFVKPSVKNYSRVVVRRRLDRPPPRGWAFRAVAVHPDGKRVLVSRLEAARERSRIEWQPLTGGRLIPATTGAASRADLLAVAPDGRSFAAATGPTVTAWDERTGRRLATARVPSALCLAYHPGGRRLAVGGADGVVRLLAADTLAEAAAFDWSAGAVWSIAFSRDGAVAAAGTHKGRVIVWDVDG